MKDDVVVVEKPTHIKIQNVKYSNVGKNVDARFYHAVF